MCLAFPFSNYTDFLVDSMSNEQNPLYTIEYLYVVNTISIGLQYNYPIRTILITDLFRNIERGTLPKYRYLHT